MSEVYTEKEQAAISLLVTRMFRRMNREGISLRQIAVLVKAEPTTVWRWIHNKSVPSQKHVYQIKKFLGYTQEE